MASVSETGDAKNVANFSSLISLCETLGEEYNPFAPKIQLRTLQELQGNCNTAQTAVKTAIANWRPKASKRAEMLEELKNLAMRANGAFTLTDANSKTKEAVYNLVKKIRGIRINKPTDTPPEPASAETPTEPANEPAKKTRSTSQQSFDSIVDNFESMLKYLENETTYKPNEVEFHTTSLNTKLTSIKAQNTDTGKSETDLNKARDTRNRLLYAPDTGMVDVAKLVKNYFKQKFNTKSESYKSANKISFKNRSIKGIN